MNERHHYFRAVRETLRAFMEWLATLDKTEYNLSTPEEVVNHA